SSDGVIWTPADSGAADLLLMAVTYADGAFVAVGENGLILTSRDAVTWTMAVSGTQTSLSGVTHGNGNFAVVGGSEILTSPDGITWSAQNANTTNDLYAISFGGSQFVAAGAGVILVSTNGSDWTSRDLSA